jgi:DNA-binding HxlR family transcriptional regulator
MTNEKKENQISSVPMMLEEILGCKWSVRLLQMCNDGISRPSQFLKNCPGLSAKVMNERLKKMLKFGILEREVRGDKPPVVVEYKLTPFGRRFSKLIDDIKNLEETLKKKLQKN